MKIPQSDAFTFCIEQVGDQKKLKITAEQYYRHFLKTKCTVGAQGTMYLTFAKPTRSDQQLRYYWVLVGLIAEYAGYTRDECHDALMRLKFGIKEVKIGSDIVQVRRSISNSARMTKTECIELIEFALEKCSELNINVPSAESLGYIRN